MLENALRNSGNTSSRRWRMAESMLTPSGEARVVVEARASVATRSGYTGMVKDGRDDMEYARAMVGEQVKDWHLLPRSIFWFQCFFLRKTPLHFFMLSLA